MTPCKLHPVAAHVLALLQEHGRGVVEHGGSTRVAGSTLYVNEAEAYGLVRVELATWGPAWGHPPLVVRLTPAGEARALRLRRHIVRLTPKGEAAALAYHHTRRRGVS